ncbi:MAG: molybdenum cofactor guanylyltransferase [Chloroflexi bacterium]|nr:molybdenum cofactor guanylyltransferase [Chloroflexota bacterium]
MSVESAEPLQSDRESAWSLLREQTAVVILAGGASRRMGQDKSFLKVGEVSLIERVLTAAKSLSDETLIIANRETAYAHLGVPIFPDEKPGWGPLMGLYSGLRAATRELVVLLACDMPFVTPALVRYLVSLTPDADVVIPRGRAGLHPLHAVYRRSTCLPAVSAALAQGKRRMIDFFDAVRVREAPERALRRFDPLGVALMNVNTPEDLAAARHLLRRVYYEQGDY